MLAFLQNFGMIRFETQINIPEKKWIYKQKGEFQ